MAQIPCFSLLFMVTSRDRIAQTCTIRHPVWPIAALQRRMRFSARLAGFCRGRCHQRRARRAELASFSAFVSNPDFRVPRLRQIRWRAADKAVRRRKRGHPRDQNRGPRLPRRSCPSTFWSRCGPGLLDVHLSPGLDPGLRPGAWHPVSGRCFHATYGGTRIAGRNVTLQGALVSPRSNKRGSPRPPRINPGVQNK